MDNAPTRFFVDGHSRDDWRSLSFHDIANIKPPLNANNNSEVEYDSDRAVEANLEKNSIVEYFNRIKYA